MLKEARSFLTKLDERFGDEKPVLQKWDQIPAE
jgi:hypothetical protein